ncbi:hypothetical protein BC833DRAFT_598560 [Globomyces pollinis-pini]|nr:hypothetical protein BC833DRAFT_598560 [Globomyces pollinis-pini]
METITELLALLTTRKCAETILALDFASLHCYKLAVSKGLSVGIVGGAVMVKFPQIFNIIRSQSVAGLSLLSLILETLSILITLAYNFRLGNPFSTYGEGAFIALQNHIIMFLIFTFSKRYVGAFVSTVTTALLVHSLLDKDIVSHSLINTLQLATIFISVGSKLPQIYNNFTAKSTGQLSIITTFLQFAGTVARIGTTLQEVPDAKLIAGYVAASVLNGLILAQIVLYSKKSKTEKIKKKQ